MDNLCKNSHGTYKTTTLRQTRSHFVPISIHEITATHLSKELNEKNSQITQLQEELKKCYNDKDEQSKRKELRDAIHKRCCLNDMYMGELQKTQSVLKDSKLCNLSSKAELDNQTSRSFQSINPNAKLLNIQQEVDNIRNDLGRIQSLTRTSEIVRNLQNEVALKDCEIAKLKNRNSLTQCLIFNANKKCPSESTHSSDNKQLNSETISLERENRELQEQLNILKCERDQLQYRLDTECDNFEMERTNFNCMLDQMNIRLEHIEAEKVELLSEQEPKNSMLISMKSDLQCLRVEIETLRNDNKDLKIQNSKLQSLTEKQTIACEQQHNLVKRRVHELQNTAISRTEIDNGKSALELGELQDELQKCQQDYAKLASENEKLSVTLDITIQIEF